MMKHRTVSGDPAYHKNKLKMYREYDTVKIKKFQKNNKIFCFWNVLIRAAFLFYLLCVLYLLFFERLIWQESSQFHKPLSDIPYQQAFKLSFQLKPFATIQYFKSWLQPDNPLFPIACKNLAGNLAMLFPMGIFLPYFFKKQRNPFWFCLTLTVMICGAEMIQALTLLGKCDVDDYILNMLGAFAGWLCFQVFCLIWFLWNLLRKKVIYARWN